MVKYIKNVMSGERKLIAVALLRCIATCLITNTHLDEVYPTSALAVGGLFGDVLFFMISGYCLINSSENKFHKWYFGRFLRIYPTIFVMILINLANGFFVKAPHLSWFDIFVYPTLYNFAGAIMLLYIPLFFVKRFANSKKALTILISAVGVAWLLYFIFLLDKSEFVMNNTENPICLILYFEAMLVGALMKKTVSVDNTAKTKGLWMLMAASVALFGVYGVAIIIVKGIPTLFNVQLIVNIILLAAVAMLFYTILKSETLLVKLPEWIKKAILLVGALTLELYVVQLVIINALKNIVFPLNFILIVMAVFSAAFVLHIVIKGVPMLVKELFSKKDNA